MWLDADKQKTTGGKTMNSNLLKAAAILAAIGGLMELYQAVTFVEDIKRGGTNPVRGVLILVMPLVIVAGAVVLYLGRAIVGAGTVLAGTSLQHTLIDLGGRHFLAFGLALLAIFVAMYVQTQRDRAERKAGETAQPSNG